MKYISNFNESVEMRKWVVTTTSESSDHYIYFVEHPTKPNNEDLYEFLVINGSDVNGDEVYETVDMIVEVLNFKRIPKYDRD